MYTYNLDKFICVFTLCLLGLTLTGCPNNEVSVPNVLGMTLAEAEEALSEVGLTAGDVISVVTSEAPMGEVVAQVPAAGQLLSRHDSVILIISSDET